MKPAATVWEQVAIKSEFMAAVDARADLYCAGIDVKVGHDMSGHTISVPEDQAQRAKEILK